MLRSIFIFMATAISRQVHSLSFNTLDSYKKPASLKSLIYDGVNAIFFDCDGTIAETEKDLTLVQFNEAFKARGLHHIQWDPDSYGELLNAGVSQYRFQAYFDQMGYPDYVTDKWTFCQEMKELKDKMFEKVWTSQNIPVRPGILKLIDYAINQNIILAVCSNSNYTPVWNICHTLFGSERMKYIQVFGGDSPNLKHKKPSPDIYMMALEYANSIQNNKLILPTDCLVIEDSEVGLQAALSAGMKCIITPSYYTKHENFDGALTVIETLDELQL